MYGHEAAASHGIHDVGGAAACGVISGHQTNDEAAAAGQRIGVGAAAWGRGSKSIARALR